MNAYSFVLLAAVTVPQLFYIFMGLVIISVPAAFIWDKYVQPSLDAKKKAQKEAEKAEEEGESEPGKVAAIDEMPMDAEGELAMPDEGAEAAGDMFTEDAEPPKDLFGDAAASDDLGEVAFEEALPADAFTEEPDEKPEG
jgi:hypothetical protein